MQEKSVGKAYKGMQPEELFLQFHLPLGGWVQSGRVKMEQPQDP